MNKSAKFFNIFSIVFLLASLFMNSVYSQASITRYVELAVMADEWVCEGNNCVIIKKDSDSQSKHFEIDVNAILQNATQPIPLIGSEKEIIRLLPSNPGSNTSAGFDIVNKRENRVVGKYWWNNKRGQEPRNSPIQQFCNNGRTSIQLFEAEGSRTQIVLATCYNNDGSLRAKKIFIGELGFK